MRKPKLRELKEAIEALIKGPYTSKFPAVPPTVPEHFRGAPTYDPDKCVGCGACGEVCPAGAITITDMVSEESGKMIRRIERNWGQCIFCSQCYVYCITGDGIYLDDDFEKSTMDRADFIDSHDKELLLCERCGAVITAKDHIRWIGEQLGELAFANPTLMLAKYGELNQVDEDIGEDEGKRLERDNYMRILCPNCRAAYILTDEWGES